VYPELFTDEAFMASSWPARMLTIGLWTQADDQGVFEWKPLTLKARILPVDAVDPVALLEELSAANIIRRFEHDGKLFGAIRNFCKFQHPQKPKTRHFLPDELRSYVGLSGSPTVPVREEYDTATVKSSLMDTETDKEKEKKDNNTALNGKNGVYAFQHGCVKLTSEHFEKWRRAFPHISVTGELIAAEPWLAKQTSWFNAAAGMLAKREREAAKPEPPKPPGPPRGAMLGNRR
jgi:hypothetical protein